MRILVVEDERSLADAVARGLRHRAMAVDVAHDGEGALRKVDLFDYDVVVLDRDLPGVHGDEVCRALRTEDSGPGVLMLTASGELDQIVEGLALGADDYLAKPFAFEELVARVEALARRPRRTLLPVLARGDLELDPARHEVRRRGNPVELQRKEFAVLRVLLEAEGGVVTSEELLHRVWDENVDPFTNVVRVVMMTLRHGASGSDASSRGLRVGRAGLRSESEFRKRALPVEVGQRAPSPRAQLSRGRLSPQGRVVSS